MTRARDLAAFVSNADGDIKFDTDTLFIDSSTNRIGLGTTAPSVQLDIESTAPTIRLTDSDASGTPESEVSGAGGDITIRADRDNEKASSRIGFEVDGTEAMQITSADDVSIGATSAVLTSGNRGNLTISGTAGSILNLADSGNQGAYLFHHSDLHLDIYNTKNGYIRFATNNTERVRIDNSGRVIMGQQPYGQASTNSAEAATGKITLTSNINSRGGMSVDTTNDRMTVPLAGAYLCGFHHLAESSGTQVEIRKNGTRVDGTSTQQTSGSNGSFSTQAVVELAASDYIEWWCVAGTSHGNDRYNSMYVVFLG